MQGIYKYIPEANHVSRVYSIAAILYLQFMLHVMICSLMFLLLLTHTSQHLSAGRPLCIKDC